MRIRRVSAGRGAPVLVGVSGPVGQLDLLEAFALASRALTTLTALAREPGFHDLASVGLHAGVLSDDELGDLIVGRYVAGRSRSRTSSTARPRSRRGSGQPV